MKLVGIGLEDLGSEEFVREKFFAGGWSLHYIGRLVFLINFTSYFQRCMWTRGSSVIRNWNFGGSISFL